MAFIRRANDILPGPRRTANVLARQGIGAHRAGPRPVLARMKFVPAALVCHRGRAKSVAFAARRSRGAALWGCFERRRLDSA
jgi:hypothetical protein